MSHHGIEIFFQNLGNADSIYIRIWNFGIPTNILIDGGRKSHIDQIEAFLWDRARDSYWCNNIIHHLVCSHSDDDHAGGLVPLVENAKFPIEKAWVHDLRGTAFLPSNYQSQLETWGATLLSRKIADSERTRIELIAALESQGIDHEAPFINDMIGPMQVLGPSPEFFIQQYSKLLVEENVKSFEAALARRELETLLSEAFVKAAEARKELGEGITTPINEVSTIITVNCPAGGGRFLFTGDVGPLGIDEVLRSFGNYLKDLRLLDTPHHGSRRSMRQDQIDHLAPATSLISAKGSVKHPSRKVVNALKLHGNVYSTHYSVSEGSWLRHCSGNVPDLSTVSAVPLYEKS